MTRQPASAVRTAWLAGLVLGVLGGFLILIFPIAGLALLAASGALLILRGPRAFGIGGLVVGIGGVWSAVFLRVKLSCDAFDSVPDQNCMAPTIDGYLAVSFSALIGGLLLTVAALRGRRARGA